MKRSRVIFLSGGALLALISVAGTLIPFGPAAHPAVERQRRMIVPPVSWDPDHLVVTLAPGDTKVVQATAAVSSSIPATIAVVVPALATYVIVQPLDTPAMGAGTWQLLQLSFAVPPDTPFQTIEGVLHLLAGSRTVAKPLPITLTIWPAATNEHISLNYPPELVASVNDESILIRRPGAGSGDEEPSLVVTVDPNPENLSVPDYYDGDPGRDLVGQSDGEFTQISVVGYPAFRFAPVITFAGEIDTIIPRPGEFIVIIDDGSSFETDGTLQAVLDTVRF